VNPPKRFPANKLVGSLSLGVGGQQTKGRGVLLYSSPIHPMTYLGKRLGSGHSVQKVEQHGAGGSNQGNGIEILGGGKTVFKLEERI